LLRTDAAGQGGKATPQATRTTMARSGSMGFGSMAASRSQRAEAPQVAVVVGDIDEAVAAAAAGATSSVPNKNGPQLTTCRTTRTQ
jgi:hypothetical protein